MADNNNVVLAFLVLAILVSSAGLIMTVKRPALPAGAVSGVAKVNVSPAVAISLPVDTVDFGNKFPGDKDNTTDNSPLPLTIQNDGSTFVNVSIARDPGSTPLFAGTGGGDNSLTFQYKYADSSEPGSFNTTASNTTFGPVPGTTAHDDSLVRLNFTDATDLVEVELLIDIPSDEAPGGKNITLAFVAEQS